VKKKIAAAREAALLDAATTLFTTSAQVSRIDQQ
jgi:hypothetical protein